MIQKIIIIVNSIMALLLMCGGIYHAARGNPATGTLFCAMSCVAVLVAIGVHRCGGREANGNKWP